MTRVFEEKNWILSLITYSLLFNQRKTNYSKTILKIMPQFEQIDFVNILFLQIVENLQVICLSNPTQENLGLANQCCVHLRLLPNSQISKFSNCQIYWLFFWFLVKDFLKVP